MISFHAHNQTTGAANSSGQSSGAESSFSLRPGHFTIDPITFELIPPEGDMEDVAHLNTSERIEARRRAVWAITDPEDYRAQNPPSLEEREAAARAILAFTQPVLVERKTSMTEEELEADRRAVESITTLKNP